MSRSPRVSATGVETAVTTDAVVPGLTYTAQTALRVRVQAAGTNPTVLHREGLGCVGGGTRRLGNDRL